MPARINCVSLGLVELIQSLETIAGVHGLGRIDMVENQLAGIKSREVYEAPAAVLLHTARKELQEFVTSRDLERLTSDLGVKYADLVYNGSWYTPTREAIDALVAKVSKPSPTIRLKPSWRLSRGRQAGGDTGSKFELRSSKLNLMALWSGGSILLLTDVFACGKSLRRSTADRRRHHRQQRVPGAGARACSPPPSRSIVDSLAAIRQAVAPIHR